MDSILHSGKSQLPQRDVEQCNQFSTVRIHAKKLIGHLKKKYIIVKGPIPITLLKHKNDVTVFNMDKIIGVCAALRNLTKSFFNKQVSHLNVLFTTINLPA